MKFDVENFTKTYKGTKWYVEEKHFKEFLKDIENDDLIKNLIFCNDYLKFPPEVIFSLLEYCSTFF